MKAKLNSSMVLILLLFVEVKKSNPQMNIIDVTVLIAAHLYPNCFPMSKLIIIDNRIDTITKEF